MVTIEQKLNMFSNLLHRSINRTLEEEMEKLRVEYAVRIKEEKEAADREAEEIIRRSRKKAEAEKTETISKIRINIKREYMSVREKLFSDMMEKLMVRINEFIKSDKYGEYIVSLANKLAEADTASNCLIIYMTGSDLKKYSESIERELKRARLIQLTFQAANDDILGGFIAVNPSSGIRMDFSLKSHLEDNRAYMMQTLFQAIEAGETDGAE